jgi:LCP family protein required for cell wall assembly
MQVFLGLLSMAVLVVSVGGWLSSVYLNGNISRSRLFLGLGSQGTEKVDSAGHSPMNILVIGSDTRVSTEDCHLGGGCGPGGNADVEMLVHLSANRTNATVMSIPRDTVVDIPACQDPNNGQVYPETPRTQITTSLQHGGPGCTVATVHALTGVVIDHFVMVDFAGVVNMSDAVGGVNICVDNNVFDPYSRLKLAKGTHTLVGLAALEFVRTRHGFGDGGDIGREAAQHMFLSALVNKLKNADTLTNPATLYKLANAATRALTVDDGLAGVSHLIALAGQFNDVPTNRITFVTMPNVPYSRNPNWLSPAPTAQAVFQALVDDQALSDGTSAGAGQPAAASPSASPGTPAVPVDPAAVRVAVENGSSYPGRAATIATYLREHGYTRAAIDRNGPATATTRLTYQPGDQTAAQAVANILGLPAEALSATGTTPALRLRIGADWPTGTQLVHPAASSAPAAPPAGENVLNAADTPGCVAVSTERTTQFGTPIQAYARNPQVPDSDSGSDSGSGSASGASAGSGSGSSAGSAP